MVWYYLELSKLIGRRIIRHAYERRRRRRRRRRRQTSDLENKDDKLGKKEKHYSIDFKFHRIMLFLLKFLPNRKHDYPMNKRAESSITINDVSCELPTA